MHALLRTYEKQLLRSPLRLPMPQRPHEAVARNLHETLMDRDSFRRVVARAPNRHCRAPLAQLQRFTTPPMGANTKEQMIAGAHKGNHRQLATKTRGQAFGP